MGGSVGMKTVNRYGNMLLRSLPGLRRASRGKNVEVALLFQKWHYGSRNP